MGMDVEYLKKCMGKCLVAGLAEVADRQPLDPINFLAHWLYSYKGRRNDEEKMKVERAQLECEYEDAVEESERREKLKAEEFLVAQKFEEQQTKKSNGKDVNIPKEYETGASKETLKDKQIQNDLNMLKNVLNEIPGEAATNVTFQEALPEITVDEEFDHIPKDMDDREENQLKYYTVMENEDDPLKMPATDAGETSGENSARTRPHSPETMQHPNESSHESLRQYEDDIASESKSSDEEYRSS